VNGRSGPTAPDAAQRSGRPKWAESAGGRKDHEAARKAGVPALLDRQVRVQAWLREAFVLTAVRIDKNGARAERVVARNVLSGGRLAIARKRAQAPALSDRRQVPVVLIAAQSSHWNEQHRLRRPSTTTGSGLSTRHRLSSHRIVCAGGDERHAAGGDHAPWLAACKTPDPIRQMGGTPDCALPTVFHAIYARSKREEASDVV
jgi:hypothetical protein